MSVEKIELTPQEIFEKEFKFDAKGYRAQDVDNYLDLIIKDYTVFSSIIRGKEKENKALSEEIQALKEEVRRLKNENETATSNGDKSGVSNVDLLRRISQLEKIVYSNM